MRFVLDDEDAGSVQVLRRRGGDSDQTCARDRMANANANDCALPGRDSTVTG